MVFIILFIFCFSSSSNRFFLVSEIAKREILLAVGMLSSFRNKLNEKRGAAGAKTPTADVGQAPLRAPRSGAGREATLPALSGLRGRCRTPPSRTVTRVGSPPTGEFNRPIPTVVVVLAAASGGLSLALLGATGPLLRQ